MEELTFWQQYHTSITIAISTLGLIGIIGNYLRAKFKIMKKELDEKMEELEGTINQNRVTAKEEKKEEQAEQLKVCFAHSKEIQLNRDLSLLTARGVDILVRRSEKEEINGEIKKYKEKRNEIFDEAMGEIGK